MDSNGNQRKRGGRAPKNASTDSKSPLQNVEHNEVLEVSAVAISPTLEESGSTNNAPTSECRRSSRKKIIKFDVRDLLNKNRKTHKIQIEARIDSNAPTTSKPATLGCIEAANSKLSSTTSKEDLLSKHKTFLEKSAIFRRYSVSQEHKAPPPPLPIPPLLGKSNDKDSGFSGTSSCQEFLSHALIKPKQPTSLIVAQIESNKPSSVTTAKRRSIYKSTDPSINIITSYESSPIVPQKKRGRPAKNKTQSFVTAPIQEELTKKKLTPEKAKNWKEYKACLAQQSSCIKEKTFEIKDKESLTAKRQKDENQQLAKRQATVKDFEDTMQSDISRSDDDGNFSGFQTSKDDVSSDSPLLEKETLIQPQSIENLNNEARIIVIGAEACSSTEITHKKELIQKGAIADEKGIVKISAENDSTNDDVHNKDIKLDIKIEKNRSSNLNKKEPDSEKTFPKLRFKKSNIKSPDYDEGKEIVETEIDVNTSREETSAVKEKNDQRDESQGVQESCTTTQDTNVINSINSNQKYEYISSDLSEEKIEETATNSKKVDSDKNKKMADELEHTLETENLFANIENVNTKNTNCAHFDEMAQEIPRELKTHEILSKSNKNVKCTPRAKNLFVPQISISSDETKSFSRNSSSSESENASERSYFSSESFSTTSSSRSYKSGDKLKVSIKRVPLPKSPSTSSQTSTSEEFNKTDVIKNKPPIAKRPKRLQKKCTEALDEVGGPSETIDNLFNKISNDSKKLEKNIDCTNNISEAEICVASSQVHNKEGDTSELVNKVENKTIMKDSYESRAFFEGTDSFLNKSSNVEYFQAKEKIITRKSFRSRKDYSSYIKDEKACKTNSEEEEDILSEEFERNQQKIFTNYIDDDKKQEISDNLQLEKLPEIANEQSGETKIRSNNECSIDDKHELINLNTVVQTTDNYDYKTEKSFEGAQSTDKTSENNDTTKVLNSQSEIQSDIKHINYQSTVPISKEIKTSNIDKPNSAASKLIDEETAIKITSTESKICKDVISVKVSKSHAEIQHGKELRLSSNNKSDNKNEAISEVEYELRTQDITKSPKENVFEVLSSNTNGRKDGGNRDKERNYSEHSIVEDKPITDIIQVAVSESDETKTDKNSVATDNETTGENNEKLNKKADTKHKEENFTAETDNNTASTKAMTDVVSLISEEPENSIIKLKKTETTAKDLYNKKEEAGALPSKQSKLHNEETSPIAHRKTTSKKKDRSSSQAPTSTFQNIEKSITILDQCGSSSKTILAISAENSKSLQDKSLAEENIATKRSSDTTATTYVKTYSSKKISTNVFDKLQDTNKSTTVKKGSCTASTHQENILHDNDELNLVEPIVTKRRGRKPRLKNLHGQEIDSETDSSTGKSTPIDEITQPNLITEATPILKEKVKNIEIHSPQNCKEIDKNFYKIEKKHEGVNIKEEFDSAQENTQSNLLSSQIKNVSIETNTLLDILRTVQSNTEAALKATKSPIDISGTNNEDAIESTSEMQLDESAKNSTDLLKIERESETISPILFNSETSLTAKKMNLSPARSDSASPLTLKKLTPSPTRSNSSSPLTLKKVTRRYERRSRPAEDSAHKTLEETFAEIAAQSSKAVLAAKEFDVNEEQVRSENTQKQLEFADTERNALKEQEHIENFTDSVKTPGFDEGNVDEIILKVSQDIDKIPDVVTEVEIAPTECVVESETLKLTPSKRGRKPKNRALDIPATGTTATLEITNSPKMKEDTGIAKEVEKVNEFQSATEIIATKKVDENKSKEINDSLEVDQIDDLSEDKSRNHLDFSPTHVDDSLKPLEDGVEHKLSKKVKKCDAKTGLDNDTYEDKEGDIRTPKQPIKKRDSLSNKTESKPVGKKIPMKAKNDEDDSLNIQKDVTVNNTIPNTPPPSKRGRKPKNHQAESPQTSSKKKNKKDICNKIEEESTNNEKEKLFDSDNESLNTSSEKSIDEKLAKKKRQRKLKEAFEAALTDDKEKSKEPLQNETSSPIENPSFSLTQFDNSLPSEKSQLILNEDVNESIKITCMTPVESEEDLDPLKDIEKFIADGVNLLKKDYKLDEDSADDVIHTATARTPKTVEPAKTNCEESKQIFNTFETPAETPIHTPSASPPPKSPTSIESTTPDENSGVRRSHRIKLITKTPKALVGRGLVRDRERFSIKDDVETKSHYTMDDHLTDLAEVEAKNAKFLKEMEERLSNFQVIKENDYLCERMVSREARKMICDCFLTHGEEERGELGCGEDCLNRLLMIECGPDCNVKERCTNKRFQKLLCSPCRVFRTEKKGFGIMADIEILPGEFIMEYVGEVIDTEEFEKRRITYSQDKNRHYYFMALRSDAIIDATIKGNISRFINHSCDPNAETQKWTVNGELRIGFFSRKSIMPGEEITFNYQYQRYGREAQRCYCESSNCRGWIGQEPTSDEGEQLDDEDDESEDEEADTSNLLVQDDDEDSDTSVTDPEEVQKQLEMAAARAEVDLAPLQLLEDKDKQAEATTDDVKSIQDSNKSSNEEDSKSKFKKLLSKMAEKVAAKQKQNKREQKLQRKKKSKASSSELTNKLRFLEDPDIEDEVEFLRECGLKNQSDTLRLSRLMVRAKLLQTRLNLLEILRKGDFPCRRLFLDYHGLRLLHGWMSEDAGNMQIRLSLLQTLETLPIANKTVLTDSKVMQVVRIWCGTNMNLSPNEDSSSSNSNSQDAAVQSTTNIGEGSEMAELQKLALKLITTWESLPEIFRIPKKERIEQMKEHEREADRQYAANAETQENNTSTDRYRRDRFGRGLNTANNAPNNSNRFIKPNNGIPHKTSNATLENVKNLSKAQRREMFAAKVARDEAEKRLAEERREFETKCRFFGLDPKKTRPQDIPFCVNPSTGQWFSIERKPIPTPPSYAHVQVPVKPKSTDPNDYQLPAVCSTLPSQWKYAITPHGKIYYYHIKHRISQWEPPSASQLQQCDLEDRDDSESEISTTAGDDSSDDDDDILIGMDAVQLKAYIDRKVKMRRQKRYQRLVDQRSISPRREEDRIYNQLEVRKYKENKEKIRKRKEDIRRKRTEALRQTSLNMCTLGSITDTTTEANTENDGDLGVLPIQDYLLSSDEECDLKAEVNSPLIDKIVEGDKIVDELDALTSKKQLKRPLPAHRDLNESSTSTAAPNVLAAKQEYKKRKLEKKEKRKPKEQDAKYRKNKEKFRCEIAGIIVHHLKPYLKETCTLGRIQSNEDFNHLARKLTHFVMIKELKYCESVGQTLVVTESVKSKSREFIKKYMAKYGDVYIKPANDPDFKDIPFTL